jgi:hypothetical protein
MGVIGGNEHRADEECGSGEASREDQRLPVPRGQRSGTGGTGDSTMSGDARGNVNQGGRRRSGRDRRQAAPICSSGSAPE